MTTTPILPQQLAVLLPLVVTGLAGWLGTWRLPSWANEVIVLVVLAASVAASIALGARLSSDLTTDAMIVAGYTAALVAGPLAPLKQWLIISVPSPLHLVVKIPTMPTALPMAAGSSPIPQRASAQSSAATLPTWAQPEPATMAASSQVVDEAHGG